MANFYEDLAGEAGSDIESDISDVNPAEMAKMLQGLDDMDDALFKSKKQNESITSPRKSSRKASSAQDLSLKSDKQHVTFGENTTNIIKKKGQARKNQDEDFDWDDPLGDILSSDESGGKIKSSVNPQMTQKKGRQAMPSNKPIDGKSSILKDKSVKDLFGLEDPKEINEKQEKDLSKLVSEPKSLESYLDMKSPKKAETTSLNDELNTSKVFSVSDTAMTKKKPSSKASAFQKKADETESDDLLMGLGLDTDKKTASKLFSGRSNVAKSRSIMDDIFTSPEKNIGTSDSKKTNKQESANEGTVAFGKYAPSVSNTRESRRATSRRETSIGDPLGLFSPPATPRRSQTVESDHKAVSNLQTSTPMKKSEYNDDKSDWLGLSTSKEAKTHSISPERKRIAERKPPKSAQIDPGVQHQPSASDNLPEWLGGSGGHKQKEGTSRNAEHVTSANTPQILQSVQPKIVSGVETGPLPNAQVLTLHTQSQMEQEAAYALQLQEQQLRTALQLRQHEVQLANVHERQRTLLHRQEQQMQQLLTQQVQRQKQLELQLQEQQQRIADYMQALMNQPPTTIVSTLSPELELPITSSTTSTRTKEKTSTKEENNENTTNQNDEPELTDREIQVQLMELQIALQQCTLEKKALESTLENVQAKHKEELHLMENSYKRQISILEEAMEKHNARLKEENERIETEYKERLTKMQEQQTNIIEKHALQLAALQKEHINDMQALKDQHSALLEHVQCTQQKETSAVREASHNMTILQSTIEQLGRNTDSLSEMHGWLEKQSSAHMELRDLALKTKEAEVQAYKENLTRQREAAEEDRRKLLCLVEQLELQIAQQRSKSEEDRYALRQETVRLDARIEAFEREKERVKAEIEKERQHVEKARLVLLEEQKTVSLQLKEEKLSLAKERARIQALTQLQGSAAASEEEVMQLKAEAEAALTVAKEATEQVETQKQVIQEQQRQIEKERRRLQELEHTLTTRARELEALTKTALATRNEGAEALASAVEAEERQKQRAVDLQRQLTEVKDREKRVAEERMLLSQERLKIHRKHEQKMCPSCKCSLTKPLISTEQSQMTSADSNKYIDPRKVILKLVAEKERDALLSNSLNID
ncbi:uncharacterized protein GBIM_19395 [Gryllus bimaculatus]|nr:uncharacterized protein GBIM_19395 [Gryllus bimaculatus]